METTNDNNQSQPALLEAGKMKLLIRARAQKHIIVDENIGIKDVSKSIRKVSKRWQL